jgi:hypothetical protein
MPVAILVRPSAWADSAANDFSATELAPGSNALGVSTLQPLTFARLRRITAASFGPPTDGTHDSVWSSAENTGRKPSRLVPDDVTGSMMPRGTLTNVCIGSIG